MAAMLAFLVSRPPVTEPIPPLSTSQKGVDLPQRECLTSSPLYDVNSIWQIFTTRNQPAGS